MFREDHLAALEAILFVAKDPLPIAKISEILDLCREEVAELLAELSRATEMAVRGITLVEVDGGFKFATKALVSGYIEKLYKTPTAALSRAALEVLSIIAFRQPVTRGEIDFLRGVHSDTALASLVDKGLVAEAGRKDTPGRPQLFKVTENFLLRFGLTSLEDLPDLETLIEQERSAMAEEGDAPLDRAGIQAAEPCPSEGGSGGQTSGAAEQKETVLIKDTEISDETENNNAWARG